MPARAPFTDADIESFKELLGRCQEARREIDRAERVGVDVARLREDLDKNEKMLAQVIHEYGDDSRP